MEPYVPFIHFLKEIVINYQRTGTIAPSLIQAKQETVKDFHQTEDVGSPGTETPNFKVFQEGNHCKEPFKPVQCCGFNFLHPSHYQKHLGSLKHKNLFRCQRCKQVFEGHDNYQIHKEGCEDPSAEKDPLSKRILKCEGTFQPVECCGRTFYYLSHLKRHQSRLTHQNKFNCKMCIATFDNKESYEHHRQEVHSLFDGKWFCEICNEFFTTNGILNRHRNTIHIKAEVFECSMCPFSTARKEILTRHIKRKHLRMSDYVRCDTCGDQFHNKYALSCHIKNIHDKNRHQCNICHRTFDDEELLDYHKKTHLPGKNFLCQVCGKSFKTFNRRETHYSSHIRIPQRRKRSKGSSNKRNLNENDLLSNSNSRTSHKKKPESKKRKDCHKNCSESSSESDVEEISDTDNYYFISQGSVQNEYKKLLGTDNLKSEDSEISDTACHNLYSEIDVKEEIITSPKECEKKGMSNKSISPEKSKKSSSPLDYDLETTNNERSDTTPRGRRLQSSVKCSPRPESVYDQCYNKTLGAQSEYSSFQGANVTVSGIKPCDEKNIQVCGQGETKEGRIQFVPQYQTSFGQHHNVRNSPTKHFVPANTFWLTEVLNGSSIGKKLASNRSVTPFRKKTRVNSTKSVAPDPTSKLRRRIKHIIADDKGPKVFMKRLVDDDSDVFLLPEFYAEGDYENLAPEGNGLENTVMMDTDSPVVSWGECDINTSVKGLSVCDDGLKQADVIAPVSGASSVIPLLLVSSCEHQIH